VTHGQTQEWAQGSKSKYKGLNIPGCVASSSVFIVRVTRGTEVGGGDVGYGEMCGVEALACEKKLTSNGCRGDSIETRWQILGSNSVALCAPKLN